MARTIYLDRLIRLTLTRKGRAVAKHPYLREGAIEAVKATATDEPLWVVVKAEPQFGETSADELGGEGGAANSGDDDWYSDFAGFIASTPGEDIPADGWEEAFQQACEIAVKAGKKKKNYPDTAGPFAGPHNSFPISSQSHVYAAAKLIGHATNPAAVRARIISIARSRGYALPKSWQSKAKAKKGSELNVEEILTKVSEAIKSALAPEAPEAPEAAALQAVEPETAETAEKAAPSVVKHNHLHPHTSMRGYGYEHAHAHPNDNPDTHDTSETAHAHEHVAKAEELSPEVAADLAGLDADLKAAKERLGALETEKAALVAALQAKEAEAASQADAAQKATEAAEKAAAAAQKASSELQAAEEAARAPLTAATPQTASKAQQKPVKDMNFDDAFMALLHG